MNKSAVPSTAYAFSRLHNAKVAYVAAVFKE